MTRQMETLDETLGEEYLKEFDKLDLSRGKEQCRIGLFTLENFCATVMGDIGREAFGCDYSIYGDNISKQWDRINEHLEEFITDEDRDEVSEYKRLLKGYVKKQRDDKYHNFDQGVDNDDLSEYREKAEEMRSWLLNKAEEYQRNYGTYSTNEFEQAKENMKTAVEVSENHVFACEILLKEIEYVERSLLKEHKYTMKFTNRPGSSAYMRGFLDEQQAGTIKTVKGIADGNLEVDDDRGEEAAKDGLDVLGFLHKSLSPFHSESLLTDDFVDAIENLDYEVVNRDSRHREVWISHRVGLDGYEFEDGGLVVNPSPDGVRVVNPYFMKNEVDDAPENIKQTIKDNTRMRDEVDGEDVILVWPYNMEADDDDIQEKISAVWPPEEEKRDWESV